METNRIIIIIIAIAVVAWSINQIWPPKLQVVTYHSPSGVEYTCMYKSKDEYELVTLENTHVY